jgi:hypothetical protein
MAQISDHSQTPLQRLRDGCESFGRGTLKGVFAGVCGTGVVMAGMAFIGGENTLHTGLGGMIIATFTGSPFLLMGGGAYGLSRLARWTSPYVEQTLPKRLGMGMAGLLTPFLALTYAMGQVQDDMRRDTELQQEQQGVVMISPQSCDQETGAEVKRLRDLGFAQAPCAP